MVLVIALLNVVGWGVLALVVVPQQFPVAGMGVFGAGLGATAFLLGARHAFDADHIAAIDNTIRKFVSEGTPALSVGFWFSLGHSSVVVVFCVLIALGVSTFVGPLADLGSPIQVGLQTTGTLVAGVFLLIIGLVNLVAVLNIVRVMRRMRGGKLDEAELSRHLDKRGALARILQRFQHRVTDPRHMFIVGFLMGLGFDTATQVGLLVLAGGTAALTLPWYAILVLPVLFTAGMCIFDTADGVVMARAYQWAFVAPTRKVRYNLIVTVVSVVAALGLGSFVLLSLLAEGVRPEGVLSGFLSRIQLDNFGYLLVGLLVLIWLVSVVTRRLKGTSDQCR